MTARRGLHLLCRAEQRRRLSHSNFGAWEVHELRGCSNFWPLLQLPSVLGTDTQPEVVGNTSALAGARRAVVGTTARNPLLTRCLSMQAMDVFDRRLKCLQRERASQQPGSIAHVSNSDPLACQVADTLADRLHDCRRSFQRVLLAGGALGPMLSRVLRESSVRHVTAVDMSLPLLRETRASLLKPPSDSTPPGATRDAPGTTRETAPGSAAAAAPGLTEEGSGVPAVTVTGPSGGDVTVEFLQQDEETLSVEPGSFDLALACLGLHWVNDLPTALLRLRFALQPDGLFLGAMLGGETLRELRIACAAAQLEREGGVAARVSPLAQVRDAGSLLTSAGFALPAVDVDDVTVQYPSPLEVVEHLRSMAETNCTRDRDPALKRDTALAAAAVYTQMFSGGGHPGLEQPPVVSSYQVMYLSGWAPHEGQQQARKRGSASASLHDIKKFLADK